MKQVFFLRHLEARRRAEQAVREAPEGYRVCVEPPKRSLEASAKFHALCNELSGRVWAGKPRDATAWKVLLVSGHTAATKQGVEVVPGLENEFVNIRESTAQMSKERMSSLLEYTQAFVAQLGEKA
jgi:hypothetical protein